MNNRRFMTKVIARDRLSSCLYQDSCGLVADLSKTCFFFCFRCFFFSCTAGVFNTKYVLDLQQWLKLIMVMLLEVQGASGSIPPKSSRKGQRLAF
jgi:hypothetical protein